MRDSFEFFPAFSQLVALMRLATRLLLPPRGH